MIRENAGTVPAASDERSPRPGRRPFTYLDTPGSKIRRGILPSDKLATLATLATFAMLFAMTVGTTIAVRSFISEKSADRFTAVVDTANTTVEAEVSRRLTELLAIEGLFNTQTSVDPADFDVFANLLKSRGSLVEALGFVRRVEEEDVEAFNRFMVSRGLTGYDLTRRGRADEYMAVEHIFPKNSGVVSLGEDLGRDRFFSAALVDAAGSFSPAAAGPFGATDPSSRDASVVILSPVYYKESGDPGVDDPERRLQGYALGVYQVEDLLGGALDSSDLDDVDFRIVDISKSTDGTEIFPEAGGDSSALWASGHRLDRVVKVGGQLWRFEYLGPSVFGLTALERQVWVIVLGAGLIITLVAGGSAYSLLVGRRVARSDLAVMTTQLSAILDSALEGILLVDPFGRIIWANQAFANALSLGDAHDLAGSDLVSVVDSQGADMEQKDQFLDFLRDVIRDPITTVTSEDVVVKTPEPHSYALNSVPVDDARREYAGRLWVFRDVTSERAAEEAKSTFVSMVSHELRTPLTSVIGFIDLAMDGAGEPVGEQTVKLLGTARSNAERLQRLVDDILDASRLENDALTLDMDNVEVCELSKDLAVGVQALFDEKDVSLELDLADDTDPAWADRGRMGQVIINLLTNALRYTASGGSVKLSTSQTDGYVVIAVSDSGAGIAPEHQERVFDKFYRVDSSRSRPAGSTGLGLSITKSLVERMGGTIRLESAVGEGSTFTVLMPLARAG
ncbi:MAG: CHASE domain-containing protein [Chloroflexi bacterium]|nr:CHASE domain-containing protein [Chloroflexota bacterium]MCH8222808.1 CHASE domain-containing protein [Chloroflexota bacterium]